MNDTIQCEDPPEVDNHGNVLPSVADILAQREFNHATEPAPLKAVYSLAGSVISTPGNLTTITSAVKTGKSAVIGAMMASSMAESPEVDLLGFTSNNKDGHAVILFDSEQSPDDFWHCVSRAIRRAGLSHPPPWLHAYCLTGLGCKRAQEAAWHAIRAASEWHGGAHSIHLDGAADFVADVNDAAESNDFVARLHDTAITYKCPIIGVIHFNPGSDKSRGHLGSQLERKAETNLRLDKSDEVTVIWSEKQRRAPIPKATGPCFCWSDEAGMHVSTQAVRESKLEERRQTLIPIMDELFEKRPSMHYSEVISALVTLTHVSRATAERRAKEYSTLGLMKKSVAGLYVKAT